MSEGCYGFHWRKLDTFADRYACELFEKTEELCSREEDSIEIYTAGEELILPCPGKCVAQLFCYMNFRG